MGKHREKINTRFQNITLKGVPSESLSTEFIAGFPPYARGYRAMGYLRQAPDCQPILFWNEEICTKKEKYSSVEILFHDMEAFLSLESENKSIISNTKTDFQQIIDNFQDIKHIYLPIENEKSQLIDLFNQIPNEILEKMRFLLFFNENIFQKMDLLRQIRMFWSEIMQEKNFSFQMPIVCYVKNINEQLYALSVQADSIIYSFDNEQLNNSINMFSIENSGILKTVDPFWK
ncbi:MAG: hypothetical protein Q4C98_07975 [Capnocytophaga sp.]|nr:hypothetical protein [Capnocytophaga sp.]